MKYQIMILCFITFPCWPEAFNGPLTKLPIVGGPGPLFAFGQNIIPAKLLIPSLRVDHVDLEHECFTAIGLKFLYGFTNNFSLEFEIPFIRRRTDDGGKKSLASVGDLRLQGEYALINHKTEQLVRQWTIVGTLFFPTSHFGNGIASDLLLGRGGYTPFIGTTLSNITPHWYVFCSFGTIFPTRVKHLKYSANLLYETGFGMTLLATKNSYLAAILEIDGFNIFKGFSIFSSKVPSTFNIIFLGPVLRLAYKDIVLQFGFQNPIVQKISPPGHKVEFRTSTALAFEFEF